MTDHDAIAARVRQDRETGTPGPWKAVAAGQADDLNEVVRFDPFQSIADAEGDTARRIAALPDLEAAYLDLYDEVQRLRDILNHTVAERDRTFALMLARAERAEAERDGLKGDTK